MRSKKDTIHTKAERHILEAVKVMSWAVSCVGISIFGVLMNITDCM